MSSPKPEPEDSADLAIATGAPEEFGFPEKATLQQRQCWQHQEQFLRAFTKCYRIGEGVFRGIKGLDRVSWVGVLRHHIVLLQEIPQLAGPCRVSKLAKRLGFYLTNTFPGHTELLTRFF